MEYNIDFNQVELSSLFEVNDNKFEGSLTFTNDTVKAKIQVKPQTPEGWLELAEKVKGDFEIKIKSVLNGSDRISSANN
jgi:hypothetical protein